MLDLNVALVGIILHLGLFITCQVSREFGAKPPADLVCYKQSWVKDDFNEGGRTVYHIPGKQGGLVPGHCLVWNWHHTLQVLFIPLINVVIHRWATSHRFTEISGLHMSLEAIWALIASNTLGSGSHGTVPRCHWTGTMSSFFTFSGFLLKQIMCSI